MLLKVLPMSDNLDGFFSGLFDFSFSRFIAPKIAGVLYFLAIAVAALTALVVIIAGFSDGFLTGLGAIIISPLVFLIYVIFSRVALESLVVAFKTAENTRKTAEHTQPRI